MTKQHKVQTSLHKAWAERFQNTEGSCVAGYLTSPLYGDGTWYCRPPKCPDGLKNHITVIIITDCVD